MTPTIYAIGEEIRSQEDSVGACFGALRDQIDLPHATGEGVSALNAYPVAAPTKFGTRLGTLFTC